MKTLTLPSALLLALAVAPLAAVAGGQSLGQSFNRYASDQPLEADEAFRPTMMTGRDGTILMRWGMPPGYYLYRNKIRFLPSGITLGQVRAPSGEIKDDPIMGRVEIYRNSVTMAVTRHNPTQAGSVTVTYQGCAEDSVCYPPIKRTYRIPATCSAANSAKAC